jgi:PncC family amidohydrolase
MSAMPFDQAGEILTTLRSANQTLATAESITGGLLSGALTDVPGSSDVFLGGVIAYSPAIKSTLLGVDGALIRAHGVVSKEVSLAMAVGACSRLGSDWAIATRWGCCGHCLDSNRRAERGANYRIYRAAIASRESPRGSREHDCPRI